ncbi:pectinesterase family protein [Oxalobacteraceae bacterium A2-2]
MATTHRATMLAALSLLAALAGPGVARAQTYAPARQAHGVNPDTHLALTFSQPPVLGSAGQIRIYDAADDRLVDTLDLAIPAGPTERSTLPAAPYLAQPYSYEGPRRTNRDTKAGTPSAGAAPGDTRYQLTIIGGFTDGFHFHPVIVRGNTATIYPHHNLLDYGKRYYVQIDPGVLTVADGSFQGLAGKQAWTFATKAAAPRADAQRVTVSADGKGDFSTVQGALDFVPDHPSRRTTIYVRNGDYEEIVYFRAKHNLTILGESRDQVRIHYANNEVFNPHPSNISTNERPGTFPSRRAAFAADNVSGLHLVNLTLETTLTGQAEGLLLTGSENIVSHVTIIGSGDALQVSGPTYLDRVKIIGHTDTILGRGPAYFNRCELESEGAFMWIRNTADNHGNVFNHCSFTTLKGGTTEFARSPPNKGKTYPHAEAVLLNATLTGISAVGWGEIAGDTSQLRFLEFNSRHADGTPVDTSKRAPYSRQLDAVRDAQAIANYSTPAWVLGGWTPELEPELKRKFD